MNDPNDILEIINTVAPNAGSFSVTVTRDDDGSVECRLDMASVIGGEILGARRTDFSISSTGIPVDFAINLLRAFADRSLDWPDDWFSKPPD